MREFFEWCISVGLFFVGLSVALHIFWLLVAMDSDNEWYWHEQIPMKNQVGWDSQFCDNLIMFDIAPVDDWEKSLIKVGGK